MLIGMENKPLYTEYGDTTSMASEEVLRSNSGISFLLSECLATCSISTIYSSKGGI